MNLYAMAQRAQDAGLGRVGKSIFVNHMPETCDTGILLRQQYSGAKIDQEITNMRNSRFMVVARAKKYQDAEKLAGQALDALTINYQTETEVEGLDIKFIRPTNDPLAFPVSAGGYVEFLVIFEAVYGIVR